MARHFDGQTMDHEHGGPSEPSLNARNHDGSNGMQVPSFPNGSSNAPSIPWISPQSPKRPNKTHHAT